MWLWSICFASGYSAEYRGQIFVFDVGGYNECVVLNYNYEWCYSFKQLIKTLTYL